MLARLTPLVAVLLVIPLLAAGPALGQKQPAPKQAIKPPVLAVVDVQHVLSKATASRTAKKAIEARRAIYEKELDAHKKELKASREKLRKQQAILSPAALEKQKTELENRLKAVRRQTEERRGILNKALNSAMAELRKEMSYAVAAVMKERGIELTLPRSAVLVFDDRLNISEEVLARLNKRLPKLTLPLK